MFYHFRRAVWMLLLWVPSYLFAQDPSTVMAVTPCQYNKVATFVNIAYLGTDSAKEILSHEAVHRQQAEWSITHLGHCPDYSDHLLLLHDEVEAYCVSSKERSKRKDRQEINYSTVGRLRAQFQDLTTDTLIAYWQRGCPEFAFPKAEAPRRGQMDRLVTSITFCVSDIACLDWRPYVRLGDTPAGDIYIAFAGSGEACLIDGMVANGWREGQRLTCDWRAPSNRN